MASLAVHRLNEFHKDIKPSNILISGAKFLLADFGLTEPRDDPDDEENKVPRGHGSYMAPESEGTIENDFESKRATSASDVWSFGCVMADVLTYMFANSCLGSNILRRGANQDGGLTMFHEPL